MTSWEKIILLTFLRAYKQIEIPTPIDLETIVRPQSLLSTWNTFWVILELLSAYTHLGIQLPK